METYNSFWSVVIFEIYKKTQTCVLIRLELVIFIRDYVSLTSKLHFFSKIESAIIENNMDDMNLPSPTNLESGGDSSSPSISESMYEKMSKRELQNEIYYHRELLIPSLQKRRVELLTISSFHGIQNTFEERLSNLFPEMETPRCRNFKDKKVRAV